MTAKPGIDLNDNKLLARGGFMCVRDAHKEVVGLLVDWRDGWQSMVRESGFVGKRRRYPEVKKISVVSRQLMKWSSGVNNPFIPVLSCECI